MKHPKHVTVLLALSLLLTFASCAVPNDADAPNAADTQGTEETAPETVSETALETAPATESETTPETEPPETDPPETEPPVQYVYVHQEAYIHGGGREYYQSLCIGPAVEGSEQSLAQTYEVTMYLDSPVIYAKPGETFPIPFIVLSENMVFHETRFDVTWRVAEPELLEVVSVNQQQFRGGSQLYDPRSGFDVRSLSPGTAHLYITLTNPETGIYLTFQQIIVIEE